MVKTYTFKGYNMSEQQLQNEEAIIEEDSAEVENHIIDDGAELATDSEQEHEKQPEVDEEAKKQEAIQKVINEKTFKAKQAEREAQEYKAKLDAYEAEERKRAEQQATVIPEMPDPFDDDFDEKVKARDEAILRKAAFDSQNNYYLQQQQAQQQQEAQAKAEQLQKSMISYSSKAQELGIKQEELQAAGNTVAQYGLSDDLVMYILADTDGPLITKHLAANPQEGFELASMSPYKVGQFLDGIKQKAGALKPKTTNAPKPATNLTGNGADPELGRYKNLKGAKFE